MNRPANTESRYTKELLDAAIKRVNNGETYSVVARDFGVPTSTLYQKICRLTSLPRGVRNPYKYTPELLEQAEKRLKNGESYASIAKDMHMSKQRLHQLLPSASKFKRVCNSDQVAICIYPNLRKWRKANQLSFAYLANACDTSLPSFQKYMRGSESMPKHVIDALIELTEMDYAKLFEKEKLA